MSWILMSALAMFSYHAFSEGLAQEIELDKELAKREGFLADYKVNGDKSVLISITYPQVIGKNYSSDSAVVTMKLASGRSISFKDHARKNEVSHVTEVLFESEQDFIDVSVSIAYQCKTIEGIVCRSRHYNFKSIHSWKED